jgi:class 3 adenylate cyclase
MGTSDLRALSAVSIPSVADARAWWRRVIRPRKLSPEEDAHFHRALARGAPKLVQGLVGASLVMLVLSWPADLRFEPYIFRSFLIWRVSAVLLAVPILLLVRLPRFSRDAIAIALSGCTVWLGILGYSLGRLGDLDSPWFYALYVAPWFAVAFPLELVPRAIVTTIMTTVAAGCYFVPFPSHLDHPHLTVPLINLYSLVAIAVVYGHLIFYFVRESYFARRAAEAERARSERLLLDVLPEAIADRLKDADRPIADGFRDVTVLFADMTNFTHLAERTSPRTLVSFLNDVFTRFDRLADKHGLEKIKTIGDAYMVAGGLPEQRDDHLEAVADMALEMLEATRKMRDPAGRRVHFRIGMNTGPVIAGVIGVRKFLYDLWGDTVNMASCMEQRGIADAIQVTEACWERLRDSYRLERRGVLSLKGRRQETAYLLLGRTGPPSAEALVARGDEDPQHVPEHQRDGGEQLQRGTDVAVLREVMQHVGGVVENRRAGERDHAHAEEDAQLEAEEHAGNDEHQCAHERPAQDASQEGEVLARPERDTGESGETCNRAERGALDGAGRVHVGDVEQRHEDDRLGDDEGAERSVLLGERGGAVRDAAREPAHDDEAAQHQEPARTHHRLRDERREAAQEQAYLDERERDNREKEVVVGADDELLA